MPDVCPWPEGMDCNLCSRVQPGHREECMASRIEYYRAKYPHKAPRVQHPEGPFSIVDIPEVWSALLDNRCFDDGIPSDKSGHLVFNKKSKGAKLEATGCGQFDVAVAISAPPDLRRRLLQLTHPCPACECLFHPFRLHDGQSGIERNEMCSGKIFWSSTCKPDENKGCKQGNEATWGYVNVYSAWYPELTPKQLAVLYCGRRGTKPARAAMLGLITCMGSELPDEQMQEVLLRHPWKGKKRRAKKEEPCAP